MPDYAGANGLREEFRVVGKPNIPGKLSPQIAKGEAKYGIDYVLPNMLHAKFMRSPYANARILSIDTSKAAALPGVVDILTGEDEDLKDLSSHGEVWGPALPWLGNYADREGKEVGAIVVGETEDAVEEALRLLEVEWEILPHYTDIMEAYKEDAVVIRPPEGREPGGGMGRPIDPISPPRRGNVTYSYVVQGDIDEGFSQADHIMEFDLSMPSFASHMPNPAASVAWWETDVYHGEGGKSLHIEGAVRERRAISMMYGVPMEKTIQEGLFMGGKYCDWGLRKSQEITPLLAKRTGRPVRCADTREETFDFIMMQRHNHIKVGYKDNGLITAVDDFSIADAGSIGTSNLHTSTDQSCAPYYTFKTKNIRQRMEIVDSNRGIMYVSGQHCPFNWDSGTMAVYMIAEVLGKDPVDIARLNLHGPESQDDEGPVPSFEACVSKMKEVTGWNWHKAGAKRLPDGRLHGASFRYQMCPRHSFSDYHCKLEFRDGEVHMPTQGPLFGVFAVECNAMVVAEELGIEYDDVHIDFDYRENFTPVGGGSDGTTASAWCMKECTHKLKAMILESAAKTANGPPPLFDLHAMMAPPKGPNPLKGYTAEELDMADGCVYVKADPTKRIPVKECTRENLFATFAGRPPVALWATGQGRTLDTMNVAFCEVAVDEETGEVEVLRLGTVADPGKVMRPTSLESQIDQVMYFSQGCQLLEDFFYDPQTGIRLNNNMIDYKKPTILDVPDIDRTFLETRAGNAAYGANGISHSLANTHLLIIAIHNAIGVWVDPPATPDKVLEALGKC